MFKTITRRVLEPPAFGLDISDLSIKFTHLKRQGREFSLEYFGETAIPEGVVIGGEVKKEDDLAAILKDGLRTADGRKVSEHFCVASLPEEKSFVRVIKLPSIKSEDIAHAVRWEVEGIIPLRLDEIYFDYAVIPSTETPPKHFIVLITAFPRNIVESYYSVLRRGGLAPLALELESQAVSRSIIPRAAKQKAFIIVDIGATRTSFIIFSESSVVFTKTIAVGGHDLELAIANAMKISADEARKIKIDVGLNKNYGSGGVFETLLPHVEAITSELKQQLVFYTDQVVRNSGVSADIEEILLCGGDANLIGLEKYVATAIKKMTVVGNPFANFNLPPGTIPPIPKSQSLKYGTAIGLALREHSFWK